MCFTPLNRLLADKKKYVSLSFWSPTTYIKIIKIGGAGVLSLLDVNTLLLRFSKFASVFVILLIIQHGNHLSFY